MLFLLTLLSLLKINAATIAIVDAGIDKSHPSLKESIFINENETLNGKDDDLNGYIDDISGWNLITQSPVTFDASQFPVFEEDFYLYYEIRRKRSLKISSASEDQWYKEKRKDDEFQEKRKKFRRYIHATHVAALAKGLALHWDHQRIKTPTPMILPYTYLGDAESGPGAEPQFEALASGTKEAKLKHLKLFVERYLTWQEKKFSGAINYCAQFAQVINASFGIGHKSSGKMIKEWWDKQFQKDGAELESLTNDFRKGLLELTKRTVDKHPQTLFVFSAGNTKDNTTEKTHYPSSVACDHCLTVGATLGTFEKASFSNYGRATVSLFAPGVAIPSAVPPARKLPVNGTSQAAPQVSHVAAVLIALFEESSLKVKASLIKKIVMDTVDKKENLKDLCISGGIVHLERAVSVAKSIIRRGASSSQTLYRQIVANAQKTIPELIAPDRFRLPESKNDSLDDADSLQFFPLRLKK